MKGLKRLFGELFLGFAKVDKVMLKNNFNDITNGVEISVDKDVEINGQIEKFAKKYRFSMYKVLDKLENGDNFTLDDLLNFTVFKPIKFESIKNIVGNNEDILFIIYNHIVSSDTEYKHEYIDNKLVVNNVFINDNYKLRLNYLWLPKYNINKYLTKICLRKDNKKLILDFYINDYKDIYDKIKVSLNKKLDNTVDMFLVEDFLEVKEIEFSCNNDIGIKNLTKVNIHNLTPKKVFKKLIDGKKNGFYVVSYELTENDITYDYLPLKYYINEDELTKKYTNKEKRDE